MCIAKTVNIWYWALIGFFLFGCASKPVQLTENDRDIVLGSPKIFGVSEQSDPPTVFTSMQGALPGLGLAGLLVARFVPPGRVSSSEPMDPSYQILKHFLKAFEGKRSPSSEGKDIPHFHTRDLEGLHHTFAQGYVFTVKTKGWGVRYLPLNWSTYRVGYGATIRLLRGSDMAVLWQWDCHYDSKDDNRAMSLDELNADGGKRFREVMDRAVETCTQEFASNFQVDQSKAPVPSATR